MNREKEGEKARVLCGGGGDEREGGRKDGRLPREPPWTHPRHGGSLAREGVGCTGLQYGKCS